jgi:PAS domain S-box-containing protein
MPYYKRFFEAAFDAMCVLRRGVVVEANDAFCDLLGYTRGELASRDLVELSHMADRDEVVASFDACASASCTGVFENRFITKAGKIVWMRWRCHPDVDADGSIHCCAKDITSEKVIENQIGKYVIDLTHTADDYKRAKEEAETLAYAASHDLQEPLRTIANWAAFIKEDFGNLLPPEGLEQLGYIVDAAARGRELVSDLLKLSRVGRAVDMKWVDMNTTADNAVLDNEFRVRETGAKITRDPLPITWADESLMRLLLSNLLSNAVKFARPGVAPVVHLTGEETEEGWLFSVVDHGIGIDPVYTQQVFGVFKRLDTSKPGTGIGLAICNKIIQIHRGRIWIESTPGGGATVRFVVARRHAEQTADTSRRRPSTGRPSDAPGAGTHENAASDSHSIRRLGSTALLAAGGSLRDRPAPKRRTS